MGSRARCQNRRTEKRKSPWVGLNELRFLPEKVCSRNLDLWRNNAKVLKYPIFLQVDFRSRQNFSNRCFHMQEGRIRGLTSEISARDEQG